MEREWGVGGKTQKQKCGGGEELVKKRHQMGRTIHMQR